MEWCAGYEVRWKILIFMENAVNYALIFMENAVNYALIFMENAVIPK